MTTPQQKWLHIVNRRFTPIRLYLTALGSHDEMQRYLGVSCDWLSIVKNEQGDVYLLTEDTKRLSEVVRAKIKENALFPEIMAADCRRACNELVQTSVESSKNVAGALPKNLKSKFQAFCDRFVRFGKFMALPVAVERTLTASAQAAITSKVGAPAMPALFAKLVTIPELTEFQKEQVDLLALAIGIKNGTRNLNEIATHTSSYCWLRCYNIDESAYTQEYFQQRLTELLKKDLTALTNEHAEILNRLANDTTAYQNTIKELNLPEHEQKETELLRELVFLRTFRVEMQSKAQYNIQPLFEAIADYLKISVRQVCALTPDEIVVGLDGGPVVAENVLEERCLNQVIRYDQGGLVIESGEKNTLNIEELEFGIKAVADVTELVGTVAYKGVAEGRARIVITKDDIKNFQDGEILVTTMTTPEFVPAMKKARAIVTNEGGVLCHAAIVARELKVPCIIGTGQVTKVFVTGDMIRVDGEAGVVKKV